MDAALNHANDKFPYTGEDSTVHPIGKMDTLGCSLRNLCTILLFWFGCMAGVCAYADQVESGVIAESVHECEDPGYRAFLAKNYVLFEVGQVHPLELSADGKWLFALNSPLGCLEIYRVENSGLQLASSVAVGLQPVSVRVRNSQEVWVVNHLSDNVSVVDLSGRPRIKQILQVGDAPYDVAFAAKDVSGQATRAFVSCSARGQHHPTFELHNLASNIVEYKENGEVKKDKLGMADLWVYDLHAGASFEGIINPFMSGLRSLAATDDGKTVYGAGFLSGNQTTSIQLPPQTMGTVTDENLTSVATARIVKKKDGQWRDSEGRDWSGQVSIDLPDVDVVAVDAGSKLLPFNASGNQPVTNTNRQLIKETFSGMGSVLFSLAVDNDRLLLTALDSHNDVSLEENLAGKATSNVLVAQQGQSRQRINLDELSTKKAGQFIPLPGAIHVGKKYVYVAGFGSSRIALFKRAPKPAGYTLAGIVDLRQSQADKSAVNGVAGLGPAGITELPSGAVVVLSRLDNALHVLKPDASQPDHFVPLQVVGMFSPEPADIVQGRRFLYDADTTSNGKMACASCHVFGDTDGMAWDLGSKTGRLVRNEKLFIEIQGALIENMASTIRILPLRLSPDKYIEGSSVPVGRYQLPLCFKGSADELHKKLEQKAFGIKPCAFYVTRDATSETSKDYHAGPMQEGSQWLSINFPHSNSLKGPMGTQTLFGLAYGGVMHHQGDRTGSEPTADNHCPAGTSLEDRAFKEFNQPCDGGNGSFVDLLAGRHLRAEEMEEFSKFALRMHFPPNPHRAFDNSIPGEWGKLFSEAKIAKDITSRTALFSGHSPGIASCSHCHVQDARRGHFGSGGNRYYSAPSVVTQDLDVPDFRTFYRKLGLYTKDYRGYPAGRPDMLDNSQLSGFGYFHNAAFDPVDVTFNPMFFRFPKDDVNASDVNAAKYDIGGRMNMFYYLSLFDTDVFPVGGQQRWAGSAGDIAALANPRHCNTYGFMNGKFMEGGMAGADNGAILTCYPKLQAEGKE